MKTRPLLLLVLLAGVIILVGWLYTAVMRPAMAVPTEQREQILLLSVLLLLLLRSETARADEGGLFQH